MTLRILVVDGQKSVRFALGEYFRTQGYEVDCARSPRHAQALLGASEYALIIGDLPASGEHAEYSVRLIRYVRSYRPETRIIALSEHAARDWDDPSGVDVVVQKPKSLAEIAQIALSLLHAA